jgi:membrane protease YdiL (CAAX protease family)
MDLLTAVLPAMVVPLLGSLIYFVAYSEEPWARAAYALVKVYTLVWPVLATALILRQRVPWPDLRLPQHRRAVPLGLAAGVVVGGLGLLLMASPLGESLYAYTGEVRTKVVQLGILENYITFSLFLAFVNAAIEEYYWRWFVFGTLCRLVSAGTAAILSGLAFASHHVVVVSQYFSVTWTIVMGLAIALGGYLWCRMVERQRTLVGAFVSHVVIDLAILWVGYQMLF